MLDGVRDLALFWRRAMLPFTIVAALGVAVLSQRWRALAVLALVILIEQELVSGQSGPSIGSVFSVGPLVSVGSRLYSAHIGSIPLTVVLSAFLILTNTRGLARPRTLPPVVLCALLMLWTALLLLAQGGSAAQAIASTQHVLAILAGILVGSALLEGRSVTERDFRRGLYGLILIKAAMGVTAFALGEGPHIGGNTIPVFYDSVPLLLAGATALVALVDPGLRPRNRAFVLAACLTLGVLSLRRGSSAGVVLLALVSWFSVRRRPNMAAYSYFAAVLGVGVAIFAPDAYVGVFHSIDTTIGGVVGGRAPDTSTAGHLRDITAGWNLVRQHPWSGVGVLAPPRAGFVVQIGKLLYVHNEVLFAWLHYGFVGMILLLTLVGYSVVVAVRCLARSKEVPPWAVFAAGFLIAAVPGYWFFPHLLTLDRFGLLFGWCVGAALSVPQSAQEPAVDDHVLDEPAWAHG